MVDCALMDCVINNSYNSAARTNHEGWNACLHHSDKTGSTRQQEEKRGTHDVSLNQENTEFFLSFFLFLT